MKSEGWIDVQIRTAVDAAELLGMLSDPVIQSGWVALELLMAESCEGVGV
jgi:hypothetical protein